MKALKNILVILLIILIAGVSYPQKKGQVHLGIGSALLNYSTFNSGVSGSLYNNYSTGGRESGSGSSSFSFLVGYFPTDKLRIDGGMSINALKNISPNIYFNLGGRYFYVSNKNILLNSGISANFGITKGTERYVSSSSNNNYYYGYGEYETKKPINFSLIPIEFQYWPFEGGALTTDFTYTWVFINGGDNNKDKTYGINIGLLIRLI